MVREDPDRAGLLYAGTEFGMYISFDNGGHWQSFQMNLPVTPVTDIKIAHKDLVLSTQGRSFWILDNLTPLHQIKEKHGDGIGRLCSRRAKPSAPAGAAAADAAAGFSIRRPARRSITTWAARRRATSRWKFWMARARWCAHSPAPAAAAAEEPAGRCRARRR